MPTQSRRRFLINAAFAGAAGLTGPPRALAAETPLETTAVHLFKSENLCVAPQFVAEELLRAEGFTEIRYLDVPPGTQEHAMGRGEIDIGLQYAWSFVAAIDAGEPLTLLSGGMVGCVVVVGATRPLADSIWAWLRSPSETALVLPIAVIVVGWTAKK